MRKLQLLVFCTVLLCFAAQGAAQSFQPADLDGTWVFDRDNAADRVMPEADFQRMQEMTGKYAFKFDTGNKKVEMLYDGKLLRSGTMTFVSSSGNSFVYNFENAKVELELKDKNTLLFKEEGQVLPFKREE